MASFVDVQQEVRRSGTTIEEAIDSLDVEWINRMESNDIPIKDLLVGRTIMSHFSHTSQLQIMIHEIYLFMDQERENWTRSKRRYRRIEKVFAMTLFHAICAIRKNLIWNLGVKPPVDRATFLRLMLCFTFEPFVNHLNIRQRKKAKRYVNHIKLYFQEFNKFEQNVMKRMLDEQDELINI